MGGRACKGGGAGEELLHHRFFALFNKKFTVLVLMLMVSRKGRPKPMPCPVNTCSQIPDPERGAPNRHRTSPLTSRARFHRSE